MKIFAAIFLVAVCAGAQAQMRHDPLNTREIDQMRDSAQEPNKRIDLLIGFARERVLAIDRLRSTAKPSPADAGTAADLLGDLAALIDELDDNLAMYNGHSEDLRRPLRHVLDTEAEFQKELNALNDSATPLQKRRFGVALEDALDSLKSSTDSARAMLNDQLEKKGEEKNKEKLDRHEAQQTREIQTPEAPPNYTGAGGMGPTPQPH